MSRTDHILDVGAPDSQSSVYLIRVNCYLSAFHSHAVTVHYYALRLTFIICFISHVIPPLSSQYLLKKFSALSVSGIFASLECF